jgi:hypothetical protein
MSFSAIGAITKKAKLEADGERGALKEQDKDDDIKSKSKFAQAMKLFSEFEPPVEVSIALDLRTDQVQAMYLEYWELDGIDECGLYAYTPFANLPGRSKQNKDTEQIS